MFATIAAMSLVNVDWICFGSNFAVKNDGCDIRFVRYTACPILDGHAGFLEYYKVADVEFKSQKFPPHRECSKAATLGIPRPVGHTFRHPPAPEGGLPLSNFFRSVCRFRLTRVSRIRNND